MQNQRLKIGSYLWCLSGILLAIGFVIHPPLTAEGMLQAIWVPDHVIILISLFALGFALNLIALNQKEKLNKLGWLGYVLLSLSIFLFIGIVYFELFLIPILARDLPELFKEGLRIGSLKMVLPLTGLLFILGHLFFGIYTIKRKILPVIPFMALIIFSAPVALKPILPDIVADIGAIGYGISAIYFTWSYSKLIRNA
jgi:uncharacterized membrane protein YgdD (TMEM256/DUF423 family)